MIMVSIGFLFFCVVIPMLIGGFIAYKRWSVWTLFAVLAVYIAFQILVLAPLGLI